MPCLVRFAYIIKLIRCTCFLRPVFVASASCALLIAGGVRRCADRCHTCTAHAGKWCPANLPKRRLQFPQFYVWGDWRQQRKQEGGDPAIIAKQNRRASDPNVKTITKARKQYEASSIAGRSKLGTELNKESGPGAARKGTIKPIFVFIWPSMGRGRHQCGTIDKQHSTSSGTCRRNTAIRVAQLADAKNTGRSKHVSNMIYATAQGAEL